MMAEAADRFWPKVEKTDGCWVWTGGHDSHGYGVFRIGDRVERAHRYSFYLANGFLPARGMHICHKCDNPTCVNPAHLFSGTAKDNRDDCVAKGRHNSPKGLRNWRSRNPQTLRGDGNPNAKLTAADVEDIRALASAKKETQETLAARYGVSLVTVNRIVCRRTWIGAD